MFQYSLSKAFLFLLFPLSFYLMDYMNYSRAGKIALIGFFIIAVLLSWRSRFQKNIYINISLIFFIFIIFFNMSFHSALRDIFGIGQDDIVVIQSIFSTDMQESNEFFLQYKWFVLKHFIIFLISFTAYIYFVFYTDTKESSKQAATIITILLVIVHLNPSLRRSNPLVYFPYYYTKWQSGVKQSQELFNSVNKNIKSSTLSSMHYIGKENKKTLVWVIGESDTKYNWSLYGYGRNTTPKLSSIKNELLIFKNITAAAPATITAFEKMLTPATIQKPNEWQKQPDILLMAKKAGYKVYWISNHSSDNYGEMNLFVSRANNVVLTNKGDSRSEGSYDETILLPFKEAIKDNYDKKFIIVHLLGSHPAYNFRYPKSYDKFTYIFNDKTINDLKTKGREDWALVFRNLYDNSILYSDHIRYQLINILKQSKDAKNSVLLYHPDHGQDVCHNDNFSGHNHKANEQWDIPMIFWSPKISQIDKNITNSKYQLDNVDNTILGLLEINGKYYDKRFDLFSD